LGLPNFMTKLFGLKQIYIALYWFLFHEEEPFEWHS
jgi:hypothetical protein